MPPQSSPGLWAACVAALTSFLLMPSAAAGLVAAWDFDTGTNADLTSSVNGHIFSVYEGNTPTYNAGSVSIDQFTGLYASSINSTALPALQSNATVWVRMRIDTALAAQGFFAGLVDATIPSDFEQQSLSTFVYNTTDRLTAGYGFTTTGGTGFAASIALPDAGTYFTLALVATQGQNALGDPNPMDTRYRLNINGVEVWNAANGPAGIQAFDALAFGKLKDSGGVAGITIDSIRVYDESLSAAQIAAIPEPGMGSLAAFLLAGLTVLRRRRLPQTN